MTKTSRAIVSRFMQAHPMADIHAVEYVVDDLESEGRPVSMSAISNAYLGVKAYTDGLFEGADYSMDTPSQRRVGDEMGRIETYARSIGRKVTDSQMRRLILLFIEGWQNS